MGALQNFLFGRSKEKPESEMTEEERRKKRKKTLRRIKSKGHVRSGDHEGKRAMMDEITDTEQYTRRRRD